MLKQVFITWCIVRGNNTYSYDIKSNKMATQAEVDAFVKEHTKTTVNSFIKKCEVREVTGKAGER